MNQDFHLDQGYFVFKIKNKFYQITINRFSETIR